MPGESPTNHGVLDELVDHVGGGVGLLGAAHHAADSVRPAELVLRLELDARPRLLLDLLDHLPALPDHDPDQRPRHRQLYEEEIYLKYCA